MSCVNSPAHNCCFGGRQPLLLVTVTVPCCDSDGRWGSAVCAYSLSHINDVFNTSAFLEQTTPQSAWQRAPASSEPVPRPGQVSLTIVANQSWQHGDWQLGLTIVSQPGVDGAGLVPWVGGPPFVSFGFYLRKTFQSQTHTEKILYNDSR